MSTMLEVGDILIAPPKISDSRFDKTELLVTHNTIYGSAAFCLNKPTHHYVNEIIKEIDLKLDHDFQLFWGGPVNQNTVWMLHDTGWQLDSSIELNSDWAMTSNTAMFSHLADGDFPNRFRFFFGQANWAPGQLEGEINGDPPWTRSHSWLILNNPDPDWLIKSSHKEIWIESTQICGEQAIDKWI